MKRVGVSSSSQMIVSTNTFTQKSSRYYIEVETILKTRIFERKQEMRNNPLKN